MWAECGIPSTSPRLPRGGPETELPEAVAGLVEGCPLAAARSGYATVDGMARSPLLEGKHVFMILGYFSVT